MGRRAHLVSFYRPGFKLTMARTEIRKDNGDLEVPPKLYQRTADGWQQLDWDVLPAHASVAGLLLILKRRRDEKPPRFRNPLPPDAPRIVGLGE